MFKHQQKLEKGDWARLTESSAVGPTKDRTKKQPAISVNIVFRVTTIEMPHVSAHIVRTGPVTSGVVYSRTQTTGGGTVSGRTGIHGDISYNLLNRYV